MDDDLNMNKSPSQFSQISAHNDQQPPAKTMKGINNSKRKNDSSENEIMEAIKSNHLAVSQKLDHLVNEQSSIAADISSLKNDNAEIRSHLNTNTNEIRALHQGQSDISMRLNDLEQNAISLHMEISGINPDLVKPPADPMQLVLSLLDSYRIQYASSDIEKVLVRFIRRNDSSLPIVTVIFSTMDEKIQVMKRKKEVDPENSQRIFFSHALTPYNRNLFARARQVGKEAGIRFVFVANGRIYLREEQAVKGTCVRTVDELDKLKKALMMTRARKLPHKD